MIQAADTEVWVDAISMERTTMNVNHLDSHADFLFRQLHPTLGSPIESLFLDSYLKCLASQPKSWFYGPLHASTAFDDLPDAIAHTPLSLNTVTWIAPQSVIGSFRVDFLLSRFATDFGPEGVVIKKLPKIVIECDGHDFHERTKEQAAKDRSRDRELSLQGYRVLRFTGSELYRDADKCACQVEEMFDTFIEHNK